MTLKNTHIFRINSKWTSKTQRSYRKRSNEPIV